MTKKLTHFEPQFATELDLDSFLNSHVSLSDEDYDDDHISSVTHRTIDEILNDTDSSASSSPPSPWFSRRHENKCEARGGLAAAAAASRLMPTPHATAIKSRRSAGSGVIQKVLESSELDDNSVVSFNSNGDTNAIGSEVIRTNPNELQVDFGGELLRNGGVLKSENELEQASQVDEASAGNAVEEEKNVSSSYENLTSLDANDVKDTEFSKNVEVVEECKQEIQDLDDNSPCSKESDTKDNGGCGDGKDDGGGGKESKDNNGNIGNGSDIDDDEELGSSITQLVEERIGELESRWISKNAEKKLRKPLEIAEELEKKQASTALHWEEGAAAQPMRLEGVHRGSTTLGYFNVDANNPITRTLSSPALRRDHGSPQVLAVHSNYIGIVMARGSTLVIPSKYSAHNADSMDAKMLILGLQGERSYAAVTSMCFNQQGDLLLAGYADGHITVWDVQRASAAKVLTGEHTTPVVHTLFWGRIFRLHINLRQLPVIVRVWYCYILPRWFPC